MSYTQKTLLPEEKILYYTKPHYIIFSQVLAWLALAMTASKFGYSTLLIIILLLMSFFGFIGSLIGYYCSEYAITNKRIVMKVGFIRRKSLEIFLGRVEGVYIEQSIIGRILNFGTIIIAGVGGTKNPFFYIPDPLKFRSSVQEQMQKGGIK
jgi:Bacterial membrane flanked domain.